MAINPVNPMGNLNAGNVTKAVSGEHKEKDGIIKDVVSLGERIENKLHGLSKMGLQTAGVLGDCSGAKRIALYMSMYAAIGTGLGAALGACVGAAVAGPALAVTCAVEVGSKCGLIGGFAGILEGSQDSKNGGWADPPDWLSQARRAHSGDSD